MNTMIGHDRRRGSALGVILVLIALMAAGVGAMATLSLSRSRKATRLAHKARSLSIAEAGARQVYSVLTTNFSARTNENYFTKTALAGGSYTPTVVPIGDDRAAVHSIGRYQNVETEVILDVGSQSQGVGTAPGLPVNAAYDCAVLANQIDWSGGVRVEGGVMHANTTYLLGGNTDAIGDVTACNSVTVLGPGEIRGDATTARFLKKSLKYITGTAKVAPVPIVQIPDIDLTPYYNWALANGTVYNGLSQNGGSLAPKGGVAWVNGDVNLNGVRVTGCVIATGDIRFGAGTVQTKVGQLPALVSRDGDIDISSGTYTHGLLYTKVGNIEVAGNGGGAYITGSIISAGLFKMRGGYEAFNYEHSGPVPPGVGGGSTPGDDVVYITAWQK